jgi:hypothetical protein
MAGLSPIAGVGASAGLASQVGAASQAVSKDGGAVQATASTTAALKLLQTALMASPAQGGRFNALV